jgi:hypothetical protein
MKEKISALGQRKVQAEKERVYLLARLEALEALQTDIGNEIQATKDAIEIGERLAPVLEDVEVQRTATLQFIQKELTHHENLLARKSTKTNSDD